MHIIKNKYKSVELLYRELRIKIWNSYQRHLQQWILGLFQMGLFPFITFITLVFPFITFIPWKLLLHFLQIFQVAFIGDNPCQCTRTSLFFLQFRCSKTACGHSDKLPSSYCLMATMVESITPSSSFSLSKDT